MSHLTGTDISTSPLALTSAFLKKGLLGKYILVFTCQNGQADFLNTKHIFFIVNCQNTQKYANNSTKLKRKWFSNLSIQLINNTCLSRICYNLSKSKIMSGKSELLTSSTCPAWHVNSENHVGACLSYWITNNSNENAFVAPSVCIMFHQFEYSLSYR